jgi:hypothetical protein
VGLIKARPCSRSGSGNLHAVGGANKGLDLLSQVRDPIDAEMSAAVRMDSTDARSRLVESQITSEAMLSDGPELGVRTAKQFRVLGEAAARIARQPPPRWLKKS